MIKYVPNWLTDKEVDQIKAADLTDILHLKERVYPAGYKIPRLTAWYTTTGVPYVYSGQSTPSVHFPHCIDVIRHRLNEEFNVDLTSCLANFYRDGFDAVSWHRDDESIFPKGSLIASVSIGATRTFEFREIANPTNVLTYKLNNKDLILFDHDHKEKWQHRITKEGKPILPRLNLTFRILSSNEKESVL